MTSNTQPRAGTLRSFFPDDWGLLLASFGYSQAIGLIIYWTLPLFAGALGTWLGLTATQVGLVGTIEFAGLFLGSVALAPFMHRVSRRKTAWLAAGTVVLANIGCAVLPLSFSTLIALRLLSGLGCGAALSIGNATMASSADPDSTSGHVTLLLIALMIVLQPVEAAISAQLGLRAVFWGYVVIVALASLSAFFVPEPARDEPVHTAAEPSAVSPLRSASGILLISVALLFGLRDTLPWLVTEKIGTDAGLSVQQVGTVLSAMYAVSALGPMLQLVLARRMPSHWLLATGILGAGLFLGMFTWANGSAIRFIIGVVAWATIYFLAYAQLYAAAALFDRSGRVASAAGGAFIAGVAIAPSVGGILVDQGGFDAMGYAEVALTVVMVVCSLCVRTTRDGAPV
ncbi:MFS transporter [Novosphingobium sp.]|uniref:MFS transporter n=1 Tax=Novosphingobium sp. TaxID=1874826 RepID=UPI00333E5CBA